LRNSRLRRPGVRRAGLVAWEDTCRRRERVYGRRYRRNFTNSYTAHPPAKAIKGITWQGGQSAPPFAADRLIWSPVSAPRRNTTASAIHLIRWSILDHLRHARTDN